MTSGGNKIDQITRKSPTHCPWQLPTYIRKGQNRQTTTTTTKQKTKEEEEDITTT